VSGAGATVHRLEGNHEPAAGDAVAVQE
jgi:hypothetical protein